MNESNAGAINNVDNEKRLKNLVKLIVDLKEKESMAEIKDMLEKGCDPHALLNSGILGMQDVGKRFEKGRYFISALIMAGVIMQRITETLEPYLNEKYTDYHMLGTLLLGTVAGDIHDLGKNLFAILARFSGFNIIDLGVDVPASKFLKEAGEKKPSVIGISCGLTTSWPKLENTIKLLRDELPSPRPPIIIGGNGIDENIFQHVKSDFWVKDASKGLEICRRFMTVRE